MRKLSGRILALMMSVAVATAVLSGTAAAHTDVEAEPSEAGRTRISLSPEQECGKAQLPTTGFRMQLPEGATGVSPVEIPGWTTEVTAATVGWTSPAGAAEPTFTVEMVLVQPVGSTVYFPSIQLCPDGEEIAWIQVPDQAGETVSRPAPSITVPENATTPPSTSAPSSTTEAPATTEAPPATATSTVDSDTAAEADESGVSVAVIVLVVAVVVGGGVLAVWWIRRNRSA